MSLYTLKQEAEEIFEKFLTTMDETTGEVFDEELHLKAQEELKEIENQTNESFLWALEKRQNIEAQIASIDAEIKRLGEMKTPLVKRSNNLEKYIAYFFKSLYGGKKQLIGMFQLGYRKSTAVMIENIENIPREFMRIPEPQPAIPDKKAIGDALKEGKEVGGCKLEERENFFIK